MFKTRWSTGLILILLCLQLNSQIRLDLPFISSTQQGQVQEMNDSSLLLLMAVDNGNLDSVLLLIDQGFDVNQTTWDGVSPLMYAASKGFLEIAQALAEHGAEINAVPENGLTALASASINNHYEMALFLLQNGADTEIKDNQGVTPLLYSAAYDNFEVTELLLMFGANPLNTDIEGATALHVAAMYAQPDIAWLLLEYGATVNYQDGYGFTPLMMAVQLGREEMAGYLLENNADVNIRNNDGMSTLAIAIATNHYTIAEKLLELGADPHERISYSENLMNLAKKQEDEKIINLLDNHGVKSNILPGFKTLRLSGNMLFNTTDFFNGFQADLQDDKYNLVISAGWYTRPVRRRILKKYSEGWYDQLWEQRHLFYGGIHKAFPLKYSLSLNTEGFFAGFNILYSKGRYWGTYSYPERSWHFIPSAGYFKEGSWWFYNIAYEYLQLDIYEKSPHRIRIGAGIRFRIKSDPQVYRTTYW